MVKLFSTVLYACLILQTTLLIFSLYRFTIKSVFQLLEELVVVSLNEKARQKTMRF
uniref:Uncharacterized protein n=1 Tax=Arundo donax TaxID=35708 RepID=A0A0A9GWW0_ARUDO